MVTFKFDLDGDNPEEIAQIMVPLSLSLTRLQKEKNLQSFRSYHNIHNYVITSTQNITL